MRTLLLAAGAAALLTGCAAAKGPEQPKVLRVAPTFTTAGSLAPSSVAVAPVAADGLIAGRRYVHIDRAAPHELHQAATLFWDQPPTVMTQRALTGALRTRFASVAGAEAALPTDLRLAARLTRFEEETGGAPAARVAFEATAVRSKDKTIVLSRAYCAAVPIDADSADGRAVAFETALQQAAARLADDLAGGKPRPGGC